VEQSLPHIRGQTQRPHALIDNTETLVVVMIVMVRMVATVMVMEMMVVTVMVVVFVIQIILVKMIVKMTILGMVVVLKALIRQTHTHTQTHTITRQTSTGHRYCTMEFTCVISCCLSTTKNIQKKSTNNWRACFLVW
jgi:hypothetical protein